MTTDGAVRGIPPYRRAIDCSFGVFGALVLRPCRRSIRELESRAAAAAPPSLTH